MLFDVYFEVDGKEVEPENSSVSVSVRFKKALKMDAEEVSSQDVQVIHLAENAGGIQAENVTEGVSVNSKGNVKAVDFSADSFSIFAVVVTQDEAPFKISLQFYENNGTTELTDVNCSGEYYAYIYQADQWNNVVRRAYARPNIVNGRAEATIDKMYDQNGQNGQTPVPGTYNLQIFSTLREVSDQNGYQNIQEKTEYSNNDIILYGYRLKVKENYSISGTDDCISLKASRIGTDPYSASSILNSLGIAKNFGAFTNRFVQTGDIEATVAAAVAKMSADYNYSDNNFYC